MTKQKNSINITPDDKLLALIDHDAKENMRTRKAQVEYIVRQYFKNQLEHATWLKVKNTKEE
jgi:hypothetical protein